MERELVLWRQSRPDAKGRGPGVPNFGGYFLFIHGRTPLSQNYKIGRGNMHVVNGRVWEVSHAIAFVRMRRAVCQRPLIFLSPLQSNMISADICMA